MSTLFQKIQKKNSTKKIKSTDLKHELKQNYNEFYEWWLDFHSKYGGYTPTLIEQWFLSVERAHKGIREEMGGITLENTVSCNKSDCIAYYEELENNLLDTILEIMPCLLKQNSLTKNDLKEDYIKGQRTTRIISGHLEVYYSLCARKKEALHALSQLGECRAAKKSNFLDEVTYIIDTSASAFAKIGHYGPDSCSCFNQSSGNASNKYKLARCENTFVCLLKSPNAGKILARSWGWVDVDKRMMHFCNYYPVLDFARSNAYCTFAMAASDILNITCENLSISEDKIRVDPDLNIWHNHRPGQLNWSFHSNELKLVDKQSLCLKR